jgi:hypothetical protein
VPSRSAALAGTGVWHPWLHVPAQGDGSSLGAGVTQQTRYVVASEAPRYCESHAFAREDLDEREDADRLTGAENVVYGVHRPVQCVGCEERLLPTAGYSPSGPARQFQAQRAVDAAHSREAPQV